MKRWIAVLAAVAALAGCATAPQPPQQHVWNGGVWNSVLGYHGPANAMNVAAP